MTVITDFANAMDTYPQDEVNITITDVALQTGTVGPINVGEVWRFKVQLENTGHMNMTSVSLHVQGVNGATVSTAAAGPFATLITTGSLNVNGGGSTQKSAYLYFKAPTTAKPAGTQLATAHIADYNSNMDHMFTNHTIHSPLPEAAYAAQVFP